MPDSNTLYKQLMGLENRVSGATQAGVGAEDFVRRKLSEAYKYGEPALKEAAKWENMAYKQPGRLMQEYNINTGPGAGALINSMLRRVGSGFERANLSRDLANRQMGRIGDIAGSIANQYGQYTQGLQNQYGRLAPLYEMAVNKEENAANRALQRSLSARQVQDNSVVYKMMQDYLQNQQRNALLQNPNPYAPTGNTVPMTYAPTNQSGLYGGNSYIAGR